ncbi:hypothetical protein CANCADRAFT_43236 [Tortispora caseinolytica NRRL Y-17796]|uniref:Uncharacterized protein n=1 Tax=Tortispora caseinolytica NRRL Y-17796 TaxID=767744 RepID=A0A1E4TLK0_9ASCO|nr:hypothetical protein CANCADRAFT_43236 [Tortispora caseinolytica NRRL Y-17796]
MTDETPQLPRETDIKSGVDEITVAYSFPAALHPADAPRSEYAKPETMFPDLLIIEESLRAQFLILRNRRRMYIIFLTAIYLWIFYFVYAVFISPSQYAYFIFFNRISLVFGVVSWTIFYLSGMYSRGITYPRRFIPHANKALRQFNLRLVLVHRSLLVVLKDNIVGTCLYAYHLLFYSLPAFCHWLFRYIGAIKSKRSRTYHTPLYRYGGISRSHVKLTLLAKGIRPDVRASWESYRDEYWNQFKSRNSPYELFQDYEYITSSRPLDASNRRKKKSSAKKSH